MYFASRALKLMGNSSTKVYKYILNVCVWPVLTQLCNMDVHGLLCVLCTCISACVCAVMYVNACMCTNLRACIYVMHADVQCMYVCTIQYRWLHAQFYGGALFCRTVQKNCFGLYKEMMCHQLGSCCGELEVLMRMR